MSSKQLLRATSLTTILALYGCRSVALEPEAMPEQVTAETDEPAVLPEESPLPEEPRIALPNWRGMWNFGDPGGTEARFRDAISAGEEASDDEYVLVVMTQLGRTQGLQRRFEDAHSTLDLVEAQLGGASLEVRMRYLLERGRTLNSSGTPEKSVPLFENAWLLGQGMDLDPLTADAGHMLAIVLPPQEALDWSERTMEFCESSPDPKCKGWLGPLYNNTGWTYHDRGDYEQALELWEKSLTYREQQGAPDPIFISRWTIARCYRSMQRVEEALELQLQLHEDRAAADSPGMGYIEEEIAECLLALERAEEAKPWFEEAYLMLSKDDWFRSAEAKRLERLKQLAGN